MTMFTQSVWLVDMRKVFTVIVMLCPMFVAVPSAEAVLPRDAIAIEQALLDVGLPVGNVDGIWDRDTGRATCAWRELTGRTIQRSWPVVAERRVIKRREDLQPPTYLRNGLNINVQCQTAVWMVDSTIVAVMPVSTGMSSFPTEPGKHRVRWVVNRWWQSTIYPDGLMYRPMFFYNGMALHGSSTDELVKWYPASHGCVRMLHADIDALWAGGFSVGDTVFIYGEWLG